jgi:hypothetical protein
MKYWTTVEIRCEAKGVLDLEEECAATNLLKVSYTTDLGGGLMGIGGLPTSRIDIDSSEWQDGDHGWKVVRDFFMSPTFFCPEHAEAGHAKMVEKERESKEKVEGKKK